MTPVEQFTADAAARIKEADDYAHDAMAASAAGRFSEFWDKQIKAAQSRMEANGEQAIANAGKERDQMRLEQCKRWPIRRPKKFPAWLPPRSWRPSKTVGNRQPMHATVSTIPTAGRLRPSGCPIQDRYRRATTTWATS